jgi:putative FmdB family regulatory protein
VFDICTDNLTTDHADKKIGFVICVIRGYYNCPMPIYEYECKKCKAHVEAFQKVNDKPLTKCSKCGGKLERQISAPAIQFKGSGWYVTDYGGKTTKNEKSESESTTESKSDKSEKTDNKTKESSPTKTSDKPSPSKASSD